MISYRQMLYNRYTDFTAINTWTTVKSLLSGFSQPTLWHPALDFTQVGRQFRLGGRGVVSCTSTPTFILSVYLGPTKMTGDNQTLPAGTVIGISNTLTATSASSSVFEFWLDIVLTAPAVGANATITSSGIVLCSVFTPPVADLAPTFGSATWTTTIDCSVDNYFQVCGTCGTSNSANILQLKHLYLEALN